MCHLTRSAARGRMLNTETYKGRSHTELYVAHQGATYSPPPLGPPLMLFTGYIRWAAYIGPWPPWVRPAHFLLPRPRQDQYQIHFHQIDSYNFPGETFCGYWFWFRFPQISCAGGFIPGLPSVYESPFQPEQFNILVVIFSACFKGSRRQIGKTQT